MNILIVNWRDITHPWAGGAERHIHELAKSWVNMNHSVTILAGRYPGSLKTEIISKIKIIRISNTYSIFLTAAIYFFFKLRHESYDVIIDVSHGIPFFMPIVTRKKIVLIVHHNHEKLWKTEFNKYLALFGIFLENKVVPFIYKRTLCITLADTTKRELKKIGFKKVIAIPPGIDNKIFKPTKKKSKDPLLIYLGRLRRYKRVDLLIKIFPQLEKQIPKLKLIIIGTGQDKDRLEYLKRKLNSSNRITFKGYVSEEEKITYLQKAWLCLFPSLIEGWGLVALEAAACGTPTIGFNVPGVSDAIKNGVNGILVNNIYDYQKEIINILKNTRKRNILSKNSIKWSKKFNWNNAANKFINEINR